MKTVQQMDHRGCGQRVGYLKGCLTRLGAIGVVPRAIVVGFVAVAVEFRTVVVEFVAVVVEFRAVVVEFRAVAVRFRGTINISRIHLISEYSAT